jgi:hypothetical protein
MIARNAHQQYPALHRDRPDLLVTLNKGVLHFWHFANRVARRNFTSALSQNRTWASRLIRLLASNRGYKLPMREQGRLL